MSEAQPIGRYTSIFLEDGWAHRKYFGWTLIEGKPGLRVLRKRRSVFSRYLLLLSQSGLPALEGVVRKVAGRTGLSEVIIHDFDNVLEDVPEIAGRRFHAAAQGARLLNIATLVIDLARDEAIIFGSMRSGCRNEVRKAELQGIRTDAHRHPSTALFRQFIDAYSILACEHDLRPLSEDAMRAMYANGDAILFVASKCDEIKSFAHVYITGDKAFYMYGVNPSKEKDGAGQHLHWSAMRHLKSIGVNWYDLGGVRSFDPSDGIYRFKSKFGGQEVQLGTQWITTAPLFRAVKTISRLSVTLRRESTQGKDLK